MKKTSAFRMRIDPNLHYNFLETCKAQDRPAAQVVREFMKQYVNEFGGGLQLDLFKEDKSFKVKKMTTLDY